MSPISTWLAILFAHAVASERWTADAHVCIDSRSRAIPVTSQVSVDSAWIRRAHYSRILAVIDQIVSSKLLIRSRLLVVRLPFIPKVCAGKVASLIVALALVLCSASEIVLAWINLRGVISNEAVDGLANWSLPAPLVLGLDLISSINRCRRM